MENFGRKERVPVAEYTIEHILPQKEDLSPEWQADLGPDWQHIQKTWLNTLGNLTLTGYNSEYSYHPFKVKRDMEGGFKSSPIKLNDGLGEIDTWNEATILKRAEKLANTAVKVWAAPSLPTKTLESFREKAEPKPSYTIADHPYLSASRPMRSIFEAFRKEVLALDPVVTEEFLKLYIAYKAETNFVDVVSQANSLRLSLNMAFYEIYDPKGICRDVSHVGRWGNGDVEIRLGSFDELPYVMGLVRQAFEKQMGNGERL
jgi:predicted transport protein